MGTIGGHEYNHFEISIPVIICIFVLIDLLGTKVVLKVDSEDHGESCVCPVCNPEAYADEPDSPLPPADELFVYHRVVPKSNNSVSKNDSNHEQESKVTKNPIALTTMPKGNQQQTDVVVM